MKKIQPFIIIFILMTFLPVHLFGQDSLKTNIFIPKKNVIRYNLTPGILGFSSAIFGYERVVRSHQSFSINAGYLSIGKSGKNENKDYKLTTIKSRSGLSIAADYRFYLPRENKNPAPSGVYFGPYFSHYHFNLSNGIKSQDINISNAETIIDSKIKINSIGVELGYQFLIKNRFTVDLIMVGPSYSAYKVNMEVTGGLDPQMGSLMKP